MGTFLWYNFSIKGALAPLSKLIALNVFLNKKIKLDFRIEIRAQPLRFIGLNARFFNKNFRSKLFRILPFFVYQSL